MDYLEFKELYHYGIKGQKWGERRFQNEDGSLTSAGEQRYYTNRHSKVKEQTGTISYNKAYRNENNRVKEDKQVYKHNTNLLKSQKKSGQIDNETYKTEKERLKSDYFNQKLETQKANAAATKNISNKSIAGGIAGGLSATAIGIVGSVAFSNMAVKDIFKGNKGKVAIESGLALTSAIMAAAGSWEASKASAAMQAKNAARVTGHGSIRESLQRQAQMEAAYKAGRNSRK